MKSPKLLPIALSLCTFALGSLHAQQTPDQSDEEIVRLSPFSVQESADVGRYQAVESTSGARIRMDLMDSTQSISVVTNEFLNDIGTARLNDAMKYVAGISSNAQPNALDIMSVRGFVSLGATLDGFNQFNWINQDPIIIDRIEVVKGPNAILAPQGLPGGVVNNITKKPLFTNKGSVSYQVGRWDADRAEFDANYVVRPDKLAVRVVGAVTDSDDYGRGEFHQNITVMPMFTYRVSQSTELTVQFHAYNASLTANNGVPISLYAVNRSNVWLQDGLPRDFQILGRNISRHQNGQNTRFFLTSQITDKLSMRLVGNQIEQSTRTNFLGPTAALDVNGTPGEVITLDPITGQWSWDGVTRNDSPRYRLGGANEWPKITHANLQNDFVYEHSGLSWKSQTVAGYAINYHSQHQRIKNYVADPTLYDLTDNFVPPPYTLEADWRDNWSSRNRSNQVYVYEVLSLFDDRLVLSGSLSQNRYFGEGINNLTGARTENKGEATLPSGGVVYKITPGISVYYGFSKQELLGGSDEDAGIPPHTVPSRQHEGGIRVKLFDGKLYATLAYFDILQENLYEQNFANYVQPRPVPPLPPVLAERTSKGFEFELTWAPTKNFSLIGSYTDYESRDRDNQRYTNAPERMAAAWASYTFSETGPLRGLSVGVGASYVGERPSDTIGQYTSPPPGFTPARIQPSFWLPSYTVVEASASYRFNEHWKAQLVIKNLLDEDYIIGSFNRSIFVSTPINPKLTLRYEF
ncbi:hypothetical protein AXK12_01270 [Cephaloticoccus capnophilus]|uniref:TonB-dependent receptor plug domain-containing protein n=2 Tax=Cephaloticoccus capnophilus TaxID=1548208 RepID=A0A139STQ9_9BACT|nr:hypothetical protein AXK12_01270 [Cephaloticoccus capnophilus]